MYYDRDGKRMSSDAWSAAVESHDQQRIVAQTILPNGYVISTIWLGLDHRFGEGPPLIFESMVFACDADGRIVNFSDLDSDRYSSEHDALAGHLVLAAKWLQQPMRFTDAARSES